jgi:HAD superfamily hydrolase (TIGR01509 family)
MDSENFRFVPAQPSEVDAKLVMRWRNDPDTLAMSFHQEPKRWETFWVEYRSEYFKHASLPPLFAFDKGTPAAFLKFAPYPSESSIPQGAVDIGIMVDPALRKKGLGTAILAAVTRKILNEGPSAIVAEIKKSHAGSIRAFSRAGYQLLDARDKLVHDTGEVVPIYRYIAFRRSAEDQDLGTTHRRTNCILFDLDGTLADSLPALYQVYGEFLATHGKEGSRSGFYGLQGSLRENVTALKTIHSIAAPLDDLVNEYRNRIEDAFGTRLLPFPDADQVLRDLKSAGFRLGLVTSADRRLASILVQRLNWEPLFDFIVGGNDVQYGKPAPDLYLSACRNFDLDPSHTLVIEDSARGVLSALRAGLRCFRVDHRKRILSDVLPFAQNSGRTPTVPAVEVAPLEELKIALTHDASKTTAAVDERVDQIWQREMAQNPRLFNGKILAYSHHETDGSHVTLFGRVVEYKQFLAQLREPSLPLGIHGLGVSGLTILRDPGARTLLFGVRSDTVTQYPGYLELLPSGSIDTSVIREDSTIDFHETLRRELEEESGIRRDRLRSTRDLCVIHDRLDRVYDAGVLLDLDAAPREVTNAFPATSEYVGPYFVRVDDLSRFIQDHGHAMVPTSVALIQQAQARGLL